METCVKTNPAAVAIVKWITPERERDAVIKLLDEKQLSAFPYLGMGFLWLGFILASQLRPAFRLPLFVLEAAALAAAFSAVPPGQPKWIAVTAGLAGLALCDAYVYKNHGTPPHEGAYTMAALTVMILVEMCEAVFSPAMAVPGLVLARAVPLAVLMVSAVRVLFHHPPHLAPLGSISIRMLQFITALWLAAAVGVVLTSEPFTPQLVPHQEFLFGYLPIISFGLAFKIQKNSLERTYGKDADRIIFRDAEETEIHRQWYWLWGTTDANPRDVSSQAGIEALALSSFALPLAITLLSWLTGHTPASEMDWLGAGTNTLAFISLCLLWLSIRKAHHEVARRLEEKKKARKAAV